MDLETKIKERIATLEKERDKFVQDANSTLSTYATMIAELKTLVGITPEVPAEKGQEDGSAQS